MSKLNQVVAVEKGIKARVNAEVDALYKAAQKPVLFEGQARSYQKLKEEGIALPPENVRVQAKARDALRQVGNRLTELFDVTAQKDFANCTAKADVVVDGTVLVKAAPATFLLFLEKQLTDLHTYVGSLPVLDPALAWSFDSNSELFKTEPVQTVKTRKVQKALVLMPPTEKHPGQAVQITEDEVEGHWTSIRQSGALPAPARAALLAKVEKLQKAVKFAREEANCSEAPEVLVGSNLFTWLLG